MCIRDRTPATNTLKQVGQEIAGIIMEKWEQYPSKEKDFADAFNQLACGELGQRTGKATSVIEAKYKRRLAITLHLIWESLSDVGPKREASPATPEVAHSAMHWKIILNRVVDPFSPIEDLIQEPATLLNVGQETTLVTEKKWGKQASKEHFEAEFKLLATAELNKAFSNLVPERRERYNNKFQVISQLLWKHSNKNTLQPTQKRKVKPEKNPKKETREEKQNVALKKEKGYNSNIEWDFTGRSPWQIIMHYIYHQALVAIKDPKVFQQAGERMIEILNSQGTKVTENNFKSQFCIRAGSGLLEAKGIVTRSPGEPITLTQRAMDKHLFLRNYKTTLIDAANNCWNYASKKAEGNPRKEQAAQIYKIKQLFPNIAITKFGNLRDDTRRLNWATELSLPYSS